MNWKKYEEEIFSLFEEAYPNCEITHDVEVEGRYSKTKRQIDILIEDYVAGNRIRIVVDGKYFNKPVDVKSVESFIGMLRDVDAHKGLLISQKGYSKAALARAYNDPNDIELDILNFEELEHYQGFGGLVYSGEHGAVVAAPFGWVIDATRRHEHLATFYQRGLTLESAYKKSEWIYVNIYSKDKEIPDLQSFIKHQEEMIKDSFPNAKFKYDKTVKRDKEETLLRTITIDTYPTPEYTGFIDFPEFILFCVLFTPDELKNKNIRKLENIISLATPFKINDKTNKS